MKRRTILAVIILSLSLAAGCGGDSKSSQSLSSENVGSQDPGSSASASVSEEIIDSVTAKRSIFAESLTGKVEAFTETEKYELVAGEKLESDRYIRSYEKSDLTMLLDADKHIYAGNDTRLHLIADGKKGSTRTKIALLEGTLNCAVDEKLGDGESFEIDTPNATMAVRGTVFTITVERQPDLSFSTVLTVEEGAVETLTVVDGEETIETVPAGESKEFDGIVPEAPALTTDLIETGFAEITDFDRETRFEYYRNNAGFTGEYFDDDTPLTDQVVKGTIYKTEDLYGDLIDEYANKGFHPIYTESILVLSEPVTLPNGKVIDKCEMSGDLVHYKLLPYGEELELYGTFAPHGKEQDDGEYVWMSRVIIGEDTFNYEFEIADANYDVPPLRKNGALNLDRIKNWGSEDRFRFYESNASEIKEAYGYQVIRGTVRHGQEYFKDQFQIYYDAGYTGVTYRDVILFDEPLTMPDGTMTNITMVGISRDDGTKLFADQTEVELFGWFDLEDLQQEYISEESKTYNLAYNQFGSSDWAFCVIDSRAVGQ